MYELFGNKIVFHTRANVKTEIPRGGHSSSSNDVIQCVASKNALLLPGQNVGSPTTSMNILPVRVRP